MDNSICLVCNKNLQHILKHLAKSPNCKAKYPKDALDKIHMNSKVQRREKKSLKERERYVSHVESKRKRDSYDSAKETKRKKDERHARKEDMKTFNEEMYKRFFQEIQYGPIFPCICCMKCFTLRGVRIMNPNIYRNLKDADVTEFIDTNENLRMNGNFHLCHTCYVKLPKKKMPKLCFKNGLQLSKVPECLRITSLGNQLLAKYILFIKVRRTSKDTMDLINDRVSTTDNNHTL